MKNILLVGPSPTNATDGVIIKGITYLLERSYGPFSSTYVLIDDHNFQTVKDFHIGKDFDLVVVCGTPWLWDNFQNSVKFENLMTCYAAHPASECERLLMGVGSCLALKDVDSDILTRPAEIRGMRDLCLWSTVITRDHLAQQRLESAGIASTFLPCPAYFCYGDEQPNESYVIDQNVLIWTDPQLTISAIDWQDKTKLENYYRQVLMFYSVYEPTVYCANEEEMASAIRIGLPQPIVLRTSDQTLEIMRHAEMVLSGRVHCAVPARVQGASISLLALDTRSYVVSDFSQTYDFTPYLAEYDRILKETL